MKVAMKKILSIVPVLAVLAACSSAPKETYERRAYEQQKRAAEAVERTLDRAPKWMIELPESKSAVFANGSAASLDFSMADWKAKMVAFGKICVAAGGRVSQQGKIFMQDSSDTSVEISEMAIKTFCPAVDITGVEIREVKRIQEGNRYRSYVLVALPTGDANQLQRRKDIMTQQQRAVRRSTEAFREIDKATPTQSAE